MYRKYKVQFIELYNLNCHSEPVRTPAWESIVSTAFLDCHTSDTVTGSQ